MNSSIINILEIFKVATSLKSLGFSSGYSFDEKSIDAYFQEIIQNLDSSSPIFGGIIILQNAKDCDDFTVIDGLQRITTICLVLCALCDAYKGSSKNNEEARDKIISRYLATNNDVKLQLKSKDKKIYNKIAKGEELTKNELESSLFKTYCFFLKNIKEKQISATKLFAIISRLQFMVVFTDPSTVPVRELYQSLNQNKDDSTQINLITNFINQNCGLASQTWKSTISSFKQLELQLFIKPFIRDFLTIQNNGKIPSDASLYTSFKNHFTKISAYQEPQQIINNIENYANYYLKIIQSNFEDFEIQNLIMQINENKGQDSYPYLMEVLDDLKNNLIDRETFLEILNMIKEFITKRNNSESPDEMTVSFASLSKDLNMMLTQKDYESGVSEENKITINEINHLSTFDV